MPLVPRHLNPKRHGAKAARCPVPMENIQHPTSNIQQPMIRPKAAFKTLDPGCSLFAVGCFQIFLFTALAAFTFNSFADGVRVRDLAMVAGARDNQLVGYGLVVGLAGDGDKDQIYTKQSVANMLQRYGINVPATTLSAKNVAAVMVTADIPAFAKNGARLDVQVSSLGDAKSL